MRLNLLAAGAVVACLGLAACGHSPGERALSGGAIGAGTGAVIGAATGTPATGAAIGAGVGAAAGAVTADDNDHYDHDHYRDRRCSYGPDYWDDHGGPRAYHHYCG